MARIAADFITEALKQAGVERIYGVVGDSLNGFTDSLRRLGGIDWIHTRHEEAAAFAAGAEAALTGQLAVCCGSCGPGNLHLINGLFDCHRSRSLFSPLRLTCRAANSASTTFRRRIPKFCSESAVTTLSWSPIPGSFLKFWAVPCAWPLREAASLLSSYRAMSPCSPQLRMSPRG